jgi:ComB9 competence protein
MMRRVGSLAALFLASPVPFVQAQTVPQVIEPVVANESVESMAKGDYPEMKREGLVGAIQRAWDGSPATAGVFVARYAADQVIKVRLREFMTTTIVLPEAEAIATVVLGDSHGFKAVKTQRNILIASASITGADTSLTVIGESGRIYAFYVRAEGYNSPNIPDLTVFVKADMAPASASGPGPSDQADANATKPIPARQAASTLPGLEARDFLSEIPFDPARLRFDFTMSGDKSIAPDRVYSDGIFTYFDYGRRWNESDLPAVYRVVDGVDTPVNTRSKGSLLIAESAGAFTLRNGQRVVCVRPEGHVPDGSYLPAERRSNAPPAPTASDRPLP